MKKDYYSVLVRAVDDLDPADTEARHAVYDRARYAMARAPLTISEIRQERISLEAAIRRIEAGISAAGDVPASTASISQFPIEAMAADQPDEAPVRSRSMGRSQYVLVGSLLAALVTLAAGFGAYHHWSTSRNDGTKAETQAIVRSSARPQADTAADENRPYITRRQLVYYRSIHPAGTIVIAKSQNFLYLLRPNTAAMRYTIGVGQECSNVVGLLLVSAKEDWSGLSVAPPRNDAGPAARMNGGQFGARALTLSDTGYRIHGSSEPVTSRVIGCFPLVNEDVIDLYERVALGTRVVMN